MCVKELKCVCVFSVCMHLNADTSVCSSTCKRMCVMRETETVSVIGALECLVLLVVSDLQLLFSKVCRNWAAHLSLAI